MRRCRTRRLADFYHAVEHLTAFADLCSGWNEEKRRRWIRKMRRQLKKGKIKDVVKAMRELCKGRGKAKIKTEFLRRRPLRSKHLRRSRK